ncbi:MULTISPECIES: ABC transporter substrate-binding protein [unclassified Variovorax]|uniref:ABC transporter substrate-binding protein n=1 Tax=unclassified Variovorax TaxID=663243 RepID=UPI001BD6D7CA|nr:MULTISPECIES: ABC transporter substrate-binding protein [unclassified Variovorax]
MRLIISAIVSSMLIAVPFAAGAQKAVRGVTADEIRIGTYQDLSGPTASAGVPAVNGMRMRFEEVNAKGGINGRKIRYIVEDMQYQVPKALQAANKLINRDDVFLMIGSQGTSMNNAVLNDIQLKAEVPNMFPMAFSRSLQEPLSPYKWGAVSTYYDNMRLATKYVVEEKKHSKICLMYMDNDAGLEFRDGVNEQLKKYNMTVVADTKHRPTDTDFTAQLIRLREANCDAVMLGSVIRDTIAIYTTARQMGWNVDFVSATPAYNNVTAAVPGNTTEGLVSFHSFVESDASKEGMAWRQDYAKRFGEQPNTNAVLGYVFADLVVTGLANAGSKLTTEGFIKGMEQIKDQKDRFGNLSFTFGPQQHAGSYSSFMSVIEGGKWVLKRGAASYQ